MKMLHQLKIFYINGKWLKNLYSSQKNGLYYSKLNQLIYLLNQDFLQKIIYSNLCLLLL